jgi:hypothetical protein
MMPFRLAMVRQAHHEDWKTRLILSPSKGEALAPNAADRNGTI